MSDEKQKDDKKKIKFGKKDKIIELEQKAGEYLAGWQRSQADYANLEKQAAQDKSDFIKYANSNLIMEFLVVLDNFKIAFSSVPEKEKDSAWMVGLSHIKKQFEDLIQDNGVEQIKTIGEEFDPELHEAVEGDYDKDQDEDIIIKEIKAGYKLNDKVIQCAKVVVNKK